MEWLQLGPEMSAIREKFKAIFQQAHLASCEGDGTRDFEDAFLRVLLFLKKHGDSRDSLVKVIIELMNDSMFNSQELLCFCMHDLRWEEVKIEAQRLRDASSDWRVKSAFASIVAAFENDWEERDAYLYYSD